MEKSSKKDIEEKDDHEEFKEPRDWGPFKIVLALIFILLLILTVVPYYSVKIDPNPSYIPRINEVILENLVFEENNITIDSRKDFLKLIKANDPQIKFTADKIATLSCDSGKICHAKAIFYFVRDNFDYVSDPTTFEYVKTAKQSLVSGGGDCDDASVLAANLLEAIGIRTRFVFVPRHVYIQAYLPDAARRYKDKEGWVNLDLTCKSCEFGEIGFSSVGKDKVII